MLEHDPADAVGGIVLVAEILPVELRVEGRVVRQRGPNPVQCDRWALDQPGLLLDERLLHRVLAERAEPGGRVDAMFQERLDQ